MEYHIFFVLEDKLRFCLFVFPETQRGEVLLLPY